MKILLLMLLLSSCVDPAPPRYEPVDSSAVDPQPRKDTLRVDTVGVSMLTKY